MESMSLQFRERTLAKTYKMATILISPVAFALVRDLESTPFRFWFPPCLTIIIKRFGLTAEHLTFVPPVPPPKNPLSLSNMIGTGASSGVGSGVSLNPSSSYANRYQSAYQSYQNQYYHNTGYYQQYPSGQRHTSAFQPASGYGNAPLQQQQALHQQQQSADPFQRMSSHPTRVRAFCVYHSYLNRP